MLSQKSCYRRLAERQGVVRPFEILTAMPAESRAVIADTLRIRLREDDPEAQAWRILNRNLSGLQARTHHIPEQLTPFYRNNNWWDIVTRTARRLKVPFYPGYKDEEVERLLFEHLTTRFVEEHVGADLEAIDQLAETHPEIDAAMQSLGLSENGRRAILSALALADAPSGRVKDGLSKAADWIAEFSRGQWTTSVSNGLRALKQRLTHVYRGWSTTGLSGHQGNLSRVSAALAAIFLQDLIEKTLDEYESMGA
ncbi:MAG: hypothetical protein RL885_29145 [Planctomycetota bacterium]